VLLVIAKTISGNYERPAMMLLQWFITQTNIDTNIET